QMLSSAGYLSVTSTMEPGKVCELYLKNHYDLILLDLQMPGMDGFQVMEGLKAIETDGYIPVLVITAQPGHKLRALEAGAKDFISKPFDLVEVKTRIHNMLEVRLLYKKIDNYNKVLEETVRERTGELTSANLQLTQEIEERKRAEESLLGTYAEIKLLKDRLQAENIYLQQEVARQYNFGEIIGQSNALSNVFMRVEQVAPMNATVLLLGETGTGKGVVARAIHSSSSRKDRSMITVNCTSLPANLIESELFGRERGAFTGATARQIGRFELANGGTIFLDEIGEMPMELQCKLLRVIQDGEFERLGSPRTIKTDVRIIAATNRNLQEEIKNGKFREDLFYRLNVFPITLPPLRQRKEDIPLLVNHFVTKFNNKIGKKIDTVTKDTLNALQEYHWPGNVRELESVIERAVIISQGTALQVLDRFDTFRKTGELVAQDVKDLVALEHDLILQVLKKTAWRIEGKNGAALLLGLNPSTLRFRMRKYGIIRV
ncbi:MAG: sigma-54-dependent Fis family transcriptional regulator, partial [Steroidobacteraceae bacterium]|nr:sigma-54-dependent Fis family transcriptional regulator [Deltaproteobacteria bacterium]